MGLGFKKVTAENIYLFKLNSQQFLNVQNCLVNNSKTIFKHFPAKMPDRFDHNEKHSRETKQFAY